MPSPLSRVLLLLGVGLVFRVPVFAEEPAPSVPSTPGLEQIERVVREWDQAAEKVQEQVDSLIRKATETLDNLTPARESDEGAGVSEVEDRQPLVYILPIENQVQSIMMTIFKRGLAEAKKEGADLFLLVMDTPGGELAIAEEISRTLLEAEVPTATWIKNEGLSAGMLIAISTRKIFMRSTALVGDCQPIFMAPGEIKEAPEKILTVVRAYGERAAKKNGYPLDAVRAMIDPKKNYSSADGSVRSTTGELLTLTAENAVKIGFASGIAETLDDVLERLNLKGAKRRNFKSNWAEEVAAFISRPAIASLLTLLGLAALFIEYKTPGFGFFGTVGLILMALVFWGHSIAHLAGLEGAILFFIGFALLGVEIFIIPGFGLFGTAGILLMVTGLVLTLLRVPINNPLFIPEVHLAVPLLQTFAILIGSILLLFAVLKYLPRTSAMERVGMSLALSLEASHGYTSHDTLSRAALVGRVGKALSPLRPGGFALIEGQRVDVVTEGDFIDQDQSVRVERVEGLRVIVIPSRNTA